MKILSIAIPCYNSAAYMSKCIESLLKGGESVEIIIVDDGSFKDDTAAIADDYARRYPSIVKAVHQENGGHGEAVNTGLKNATGVFFKVVDSDDWVDGEAYAKVLKALKYMIKENKNLDMLLTNFVYEKQGEKHGKVMSYTGAAPKGKMTSWDSGMKFRKPQYILMHSVIYRTALLLECGLKLPKHMFYVDNIFVFQPLPHVKNIYYLDVDFYRYYIGREDQSVNEKIMISRVDQQISITKIMIDIYKNSHIGSKELDRYMLQYLDMMMCISSILLILADTGESLEKKEELWRYLKNTDMRLYRKFRYSLLGVWMNFPGRYGRKISVAGYKAARKIFKFN